MQGFDCESITLKICNIFECMEIAEYIFEGVVGPSYKKTTREYYKHARLSRKMRGEYSLSTTYYEMSNISVNHRKFYVDYPKDIFKLTFIIHGPRYPSDKCKVLGDVGSEYAKSRTTKDRMHESATKKVFGRQKENNTIVQHTVYEIILQEKERLNVKDETHENIDYEVDEDDLYEL